MNCCPYCGRAYADECEIPFFWYEDTRTPNTYTVTSTVSSTSTTYPSAAMRYTKYCQCVVLPSSGNYTDYSDDFYFVVKKARPKSVVEWDTWRRPNRVQMLAPKMPRRAPQRHVYVPYRYEARRRPTRNFHK